MNIVSVGSSLMAAALLAALTVASDAAAQSNLAQCRVRMAEGALDMMKARHRLGRSCYKDGTYCFGLSSSADDELELAISGVDSACVAAVVLDDVPFEELAPAPCPPSWSSCDNNDPTPDSVQDSTSCQRCMATGRDNRLRLDFEVGARAPRARANISTASESQLQCASKVYASMGRAAERGLREAIACAADSGEPPWSCSTAVAPDSRFDRALRKIERVAEKCEPAILEADSILGRFCHQPVLTPAKLASCVQRAAMCRACQAANATLGLGQDCVVQSGDRLCDSSVDGTFGRPSSGNFFVTNRGDDSITMLNYDVDYLFGTLESSTFPVGAGPADVAVNTDVALVYTANQDEDTVSFLHASTGQPAFGSMLASTIPVGSQPSGLALHSRGILYVANEGDGTVTFLDAVDGSYMFGDLASSTVTTGAGAAALGLNETDGVLYVANSGGDTVTFLDAMTGAPFMGSIAASTFPTGDEPRSVNYSSDNDLLYVTNHAGGTIAILDPRTGIPAFGTLPASTVSAGTGAISSIAWQSHLITVAREGESVSVHSETPIATIDGPVTFDIVDLGGVGSDLAKAVWYYDDSLYVTVESDDLLAAVPYGRPEAAVGFSAAEGASILVDAISDSAAVNEITGEYCMSMNGSGAFGAIDPVTRSVDLRGAFSHGSVITVDAAANIAYVSDYWDERVYLYDATTGDFLGLSPHICYDMIGLAVAPATGTLLVRCRNLIAYLDAATGAYRTGSGVTSTLYLDNYGFDIVVDEADDRIYVDQIDNFPNETAVVALTIGTVGYANGTLAASKMLVGTGDRGLAIDAAANVLYRGNVNGQVRLYDTAGSLLATTSLPSNYPLSNMRLTANLANGILYVSRTWASPPDVDLSADDVVYLNASDATYLNTTLEDSSVRIGTGSGLSNAVISAATGTIAVVRHNKYPRQLVLLDPDEPVALGERQAYRDSIATGDAPSAVTVVP